MMSNISTDGCEYQVFFFSIVRNIAAMFPTYKGMIWWRGTQGLSTIDRRRICSFISMSHAIIDI